MNIADFDIKPEETEKIKKMVEIYKYVDKIGEHIKKIKLDLKGHFHGLEEKDASRFLDNTPSYIRYDGNNIEVVKAVAKACEKGEACSQKIIIEPIQNKCFICDEEVNFTFDGVNLCTDSECRFPNGMPEYSIYLSVPSGKLVVANDLRHLFDDEYEEEDLRPSSRGWGFDINTVFGCRQVFETYGKLGMAHGFVGNTCPGMYRINEDTLTLSMLAYDEETYESCGQPPGERVAGVCTDLWWYSIIDYDDYIRRTGNPNKFYDIVDVKPGIYRVTHRTHMFDTWANATEHFAVFERVGEHTGLKPITKLSPVSVEDAIRAEIIFGVGDNINRARALDMFFFVVGTGDSWKNGCIRSHMSPRKLLDRLDESKTKIPNNIEERMKDITIDNTYPISDYSNICNIPDDVKSDWLAAAFEALNIALALDPEIENYSCKNSDIIEKAKKIKQELEKRFEVK